MKTHLLLLLLCLSIACLCPCSLAESADGGFIAQVDWLHVESLGSECMLMVTDGADIQRLIQLFPPGHMPDGSMWCGIGEREYDVSDAMADMPDGILLTFHKKGAAVGSGGDIPEEGYFDILVCVNGEGFQINDMPFVEDPYCYRLVTAYIDACLERAPYQVAAS